MIPTIIISICIILLISGSLLFFPTIKVGKITFRLYWLIALIGAIILLAFSLAPIDVVFTNLTNDNSVNPLKIIILFFSMTGLSIFLDEVGLFHYLANKAVKISGNNQFILFIIFYGLTSVLTIFTSNDVVILTFTPFICFFCKNSKVNPIPYLVGEFTAANTWSLLLMIGNPTNIYLAGSANITFFEYFKVMIIPTIVGGLLELAILLLIFNKKLKTPVEHNHDDFKLKDIPSLVIGLFFLTICLIFLVISSYLNIEMYLISLFSFIGLLISYLFTCLIRQDQPRLLINLFKKLPYPLIPFFISMFVIVVSLNYQGITTIIADFLNNGHPIYLYGYTSFLACNVINNIPMSILYSDLCLTVNSSNYLSSIYASVIGSNIGAFLTPIGALAGIMFTGLVSQHDTKYSFVDFIKYGLITSIPVISVMLLMLDVIL